MATLTELTKPTITQATDYITSRYTQYNPLRVNWVILSDGDKNTYINQSYDEIKGLLFKEYTPFENVIDIITENALAIMDKEMSVSDVQHRTMQSLGQQKNTKYNRREQGDVLGINKSETVKAPIPITGEKAYQMLRLYIGGSFKIL